MITAALILLAQFQDAAFSAALKDLGASRGITFTFVDRTISGWSTDWTMTVLKPNRFSAVSNIQEIVADGETIVVLDKGASTYVRLEQTEEVLTKLIRKPEMLPVRLFLDPKGDWLKSARPAGSRERRGVDLTGTSLSMGFESTATVYFSNADRTINYVQIESEYLGVKQTRILDRFKVERSTPADSVFVFKPSPGAVEVDGQSVSLKSDISEDAKKDIAIGKIGYKKLTWDDFRIVESGSRGVLAYTKAHIGWSYETEIEIDGRSYVATLKSIEIRSGLDTKETWRRSGISQADLDRLLPHEQGHLDINETRAKRLRQTKLSDWPTGRGASAPSADKDLRAQIKEIVEAELAEVRRQHNQYDKETKRGVDAAAQRRWAAQIAAQLNGK